MTQEFQLQHTPTGIFWTMGESMGQHTSTHTSSGPLESRWDEPSVGSYSNYYHPVSETSDPYLGFQ